VKKHFIIAIFLISLFSCNNGTNDLELDEDYYTVLDNKFVMVNLSESPEAFPNPIKGFLYGIGHESNNFRNHEFARVYRQYIKYTDLESSSADTVQKIINWSNTAWQGIENRNIKVIPRVVLSYPKDTQLSQISNPGNNFWPDDIPQPSVTERWTTNELKARLGNFIMKLGEAWDNDPRVAAIELGLWGHWGEQHIWPLTLSTGDRIPQDMQKVLGDAASLAFKNKKVMVRYPETFLNYKFGFYWDSFAVPYDSNCGEEIIARNLWKNQMISGETTAYDWGAQTPEGGSPNATLKNNNAVDYIIDWIGRLNASSLGFIAYYDQNDRSLSQNTERIQKKLGYRFVINSVVYNNELNPGDELSIEIKLTNVGSAPFYYQWPVELSLLDMKRKVVWKSNLAADIRDWLPNESVTVSEKIIIPSTIKNDNYILAMSILDPSGNLPSLRFANTNYYSGGRTPLGIIGIGQEPKKYSLKPYNSLKTDGSLHYSL
jgi:hypothetical protein